MLCCWSRWCGGESWRANETSRSFPHTVICTFPQQAASPTNGVSLIRSRSSKFPEAVLQNTCPASVLPQSLPATHHRSLNSERHPRTRTALTRHTSTHRDPYDYPQSSFTHKPISSSSKVLLNQIRPVLTAQPATPDSLPQCLK